MDIIADLFAGFDRLALAGFHNVQAMAKADGSIVTQVDHDASALALGLLKRHFPADGIVCEEEPIPHQPQAPRQWVIDPLDGTAMFSRGFPAWGMGLALLQGGHPLEGYLRFPLLGETYGFYQGQGWLNGQPFRRLDPVLLPDNQMLMVGAKLHWQLPLDRLETYKLRDFGSTLYHIISVALGRAEAVITPRCCIWDLAPALPFTRAMGLTEQFLDGSPLSLEALLDKSKTGHKISQPLIIGTPETVQELRAALI